jgi:ATP-dependent Clp protease ATP-binding subunit ClpB
VKHASHSPPTPTPTPPHPQHTPNTGAETYASLLRCLRKRLVRLPTIDPAPDQVYPSKDFSAVLKKAQQDQKKRGDTYLGVDVLLLALLNDGEIAAAIAEAGLTKQAIENALHEVRPAVRVACGQ